MRFNSIPKTNIAETKPIIRKILQDGESLSAIFYRNIESKDFNDVYKEFVDNHCKQADGTTATFYEMIVFYPANPSSYDFTTLKQVYDEYVRLRGATDTLGISKISIEKDAIRIDSLLSGNELGKLNLLPAPTDVLKALEGYLAVRHPDLVNKQKKRNSKRPHKVYSEDEKTFFRRIRKHKEKLKELSDRINQLMVQSKTVYELMQKIESDKELEIYSHDGKPIGIKFQNQKYRFLTIGICSGKQAQIEQFYERTQDIKPLTFSKENRTEKLRC